MVIRAQPTRNGANCGTNQCRRRLRTAFSRPVEGISACESLLRRVGELTPEQPFGDLQRGGPAERGLQHGGGVARTGVPARGARGGSGVGGGRPAREFAADPCSTIRLFPGVRSPDWQKSTAPSSSAWYPIRPSKKTHSPGVRSSSSYQRPTSSMWSWIRWSRAWEASCFGRFELKRHLEPGATGLAADFFVLIRDHHDCSLGRNSRTLSLRQIDVLVKTRNLRVTTSSDHWTRNLTCPRWPPRPLPPTSAASRSRHAALTPSTTRSHGSSVSRCQFVTSPSRSCTTHSPSSPAMAT